MLIFCFSVFVFINYKFFFFFFNFSFFIFFFFIFFSSFLVFCFSFFFFHLLFFIFRYSFFRFSFFIIHFSFFFGLWHSSANLKIPIRPPQVHPGHRSYDGTPLVEVNQAIWFGTKIWEEQTDTQTHRQTDRAVYRVAPQLKIWI